MNERNTYSNEPSDLFKLLLVRFFLKSNQEFFISEALRKFIVLFNFPDFCNAVIWARKQLVSRGRKLTEMNSFRVAAETSNKFW